MIKYATAKKSGVTDTVFKIDTGEPQIVHNMSPRRTIAEWLNQNPHLEVISVYECVHTTIPKEVVCWYNDHKTAPIKLEEMKQFR